MSSGIPHNTGFPEHGAWVAGKGLSLKVQLHVAVGVGVPDGQARQFDFKGPGNVVQQPGPADFIVFIQADADIENTLGQLMQRQGKFQFLLPRLQRAGLGPGGGQPGIRIRAQCQAEPNPAAFVGTNPQAQAEHRGTVLLC